MFGYAIDVQVGVPRVWSWIATICLIAGSLFLYDGMAISWITLLVGIIGISLSMIAGMPSMIRTRFGTPTIGREWMIGMGGEAVEAVQPLGVVRIADSLWRARTFRASPIAPGEPVRVTGIDGLLLEVSPVDIGDEADGDDGRDAGDGAEAPPAGTETGEEPA